MLLDDGVSEKKYNSMADLFQVFAEGKKTHLLIKASGLAPLFQPVPKVKMKITTKFLTTGQFEENF